MQIESRTTRLDIGNKKTIYPIAGYSETGKLIHIDIKVGHQERCSEVLDGKRLQQLRSLLEIVCDLTNALLRMDWTKADVIRKWKGTQCEPSGLCPQLKCIAKSPLDAVARWLEGERE